jgi:hypothetical protein
LDVATDAEIAPRGPGRPAKPITEKYVKMSVKLDPELYKRLTRLIDRRKLKTSDAIRAAIELGLRAM